MFYQFLVDALKVVCVNWLLEVFLNEYAENFCHWDLVPTSFILEWSGFLEGEIKILEVFSFYLDKLKAFFPIKTVEFRTKMSKCFIFALVGFKKATEVHRSSKELFFIEK